MADAKFLKPDTLALHAGQHPDRKTTGLLHRLETAGTPEEADAAGRAFRAWAQEHDLLLIPPEDSETPSAH